MKFEKKQTFMILFEVGILFCSILLLTLGYTPDNFAAYSRFGAIILVLDLILFCIAQTKILTAQTLFMVMFILFQFGLPVVYALDSKHYNFYITLFNESLLIDAVKYTILATQVFFVTATIVIAKQSRKDNNVGVLKWKRTILANPRQVEEAALILFITTAIVAVPINLLAAIRAMTADVAIGSSYRGAMSESALTRFFQEYFYSSGLLYLCFSNQKKKKRIVSILYLVVAFSMVLVADRSGGVTAIVVYMFYCYYSGGGKKKKKNAVMLISVGILLAIASSAIAAARIGQSSGGIDKLILDALEEMGFNFTSLCFVMDYIPSQTNYRAGMSYLVALVLLIPKSLGLGTIYPKLQSFLGETWLWNANNMYGREFLSFGVGFSLIAESYYNFSWIGVLTMIPISAIITYFLCEKKKENQWSVYVKLALMLSLFTVPRRQFQSVIKALEYSVLFTMLYLVLYIRIKKRSCKNNMLHSATEL